MDFFHYQQQAKKRTTLLIVLYGVTVLFLIGSVYALFVFIALMAGGDYAKELGQKALIDPTVLPLVVGGVSLLVLGGSFFKSAQLAAGGGKAVAEMMGGRLVSPAPLILPNAGSTTSSRNCRWLPACPCRRFTSWTTSQASTPSPPAMLRTKP